MRQNPDLKFLANKCLILFEQYENNKIKSPSLFGAIEMNDKKLRDKLK